MTNRTLLLNATEEPHKIISVPRAIRLMMDGKAEMVEDSGERYHSQFDSVPVPSILRLRRYVHVPHRRSVPLSTRTVLARDSYTCGYCGGVATTMDHIIPRSKGGPNSWENVVAACRRCNHKKGQKTLEQMGWSLKITPYKPRGQGAWLLTFKPEESWERFFSG